MRITEEDSGQLRRNKNQETCTGLIDTNQQQKHMPQVQSAIMRRNRLEKLVISSQVMLLIATGLTTLFLVIASSMPDKNPLLTVAVMTGSIGLLMAFVYARASHLLPHASEDVLKQVVPGEYQRLQETEHALQALLKSEHR